MEGRLQVRTAGAPSSPSTLVRTLQFPLPNVPVLLPTIQNIIHQESYTVAATSLRLPASRVCILHVRHSSIGYSPHRKFHSSSVRAFHASQVHCRLPVLHTALHRHSATCVLSLLGPGFKKLWCNEGGIPVVLNGVIYYWKILVFIAQYGFLHPHYLLSWSFLDWLPRLAAHRLAVTMNSELTKVGPAWVPSCFCNALPERGKGCDLWSALEMEGGKEWMMAPDVTDTALHMHHILLPGGKSYVWWSVQPCPKKLQYKPHTLLTLWHLTYPASWLHLVWVLYTVDFEKYQPFHDQTKIGPIHVVFQKLIEYLESIGKF